MTKKSKSNRHHRQNAFDRARDAVLAIDTGWWTSIAGSGITEIGLSDPEYLSLGDEKTIVGGLVFERRTVTMRHPDHVEAVIETVTRPVMTRFSSLPIDLLERLARDILEQGEAERRKANLANVIAAAQSFDEEERLKIAREILGEDADDDTVKAMADQLRMSAELIAGGERAAKFFDDMVSTVTIEDDPEEGQRIVPEICLPRARHR
jgi:hypothetical protein